MELAKRTKQSTHCNNEVKSNTYRISSYIIIELTQLSDDKWFKLLE